MHKKVISHGVIKKIVYKFIFSLVLTIFAEDKLHLGIKTLINMTQLTVSLEDTTPSMLKEIKKAISLLRGVIDVKVANTEKECVNPETAQAIEEAENGKTFKCKNFDEYLKLVGYGVHD